MRRSVAGRPTPAAPHQPTGRPAAASAALGRRPAERGHAGRPPPGRSRTGQWPRCMAESCPDGRWCSRHPNGPLSQDRLDRDVILTNKRRNAVVLVPIGAKRIKFRDRYDKNARFSVKISILSMSSSYQLAAATSSGGARISCAPAGKHTCGTYSIGTVRTSFAPVE